MNIQQLHISKIIVQKGEKIPADGKKEEKQLFYAASGRGFYQQENRIRSFTAGDTVVAESVTEVMSDAIEGLVYYQIGWCGEVPLRAVHSVAPSIVVPLLEEWLSRQQTKNAIDSLLTGYALFFRFLAAVSVESAPCTMEESAVLINDHLAEPISVSELAARVNMTPPAFTRAFRKKFGCSPTQFMQSERMRRAKECLVQQHPVTLKEIGVKIGIEDEFYFSRLFKKIEGVAPTIFLKKTKPRVAVVSGLLLQDHLLSLGVQPIAAPCYPSMFPNTKGIPSYLRKELEGTRLLNAEKSMPVEEIFRLKPDLILKTACPSDAEQPFWHHHSPVELLPVHQEWDEYLDSIASRIGKEKQAEQVKAAVHQLEEVAKKKLRISGEWVILHIHASEIRLYGRTGDAYSNLFFQRLGFTPHPELPEHGYQMVTAQALAAMQPEQLLILRSKPCDVERVTKDEAWKTLKAVQTDSVYMPDSVEWDAWGPSGRSFMIEGLVRYFSSRLHLCKGLDKNVHGSFN